MCTPRQFREFALECMHLAAETNDERQRQILLGMAARWMRAAVQLEQSIELLDGDKRQLDDDVPVVRKNDKA